jgi:hypothetical protein
MSTYGFYDVATGDLHSKVYFCNAHSGAAKDLASNTPPGHKPIAGRFNYMKHRVDLATGAVVAIIPAVPVAPAVVAGPPVTAVTSAVIPPVTAVTSPPP